MEIDIVVTWVDGNDLEWKNNKNKYSSNKLKSYTQGDSIERYRDWGLMPFWFRSIEKYAHWVHKIFFVTCGHYPKWLNLRNEKLCLVRHDEFMPAEYLPTFSSYPIELNLHRIKGLSEYFIYFNDDMFLNTPVYPDDFFKTELPCDFCEFNILAATKPDDVFLHTLLNSNGIINRHFTAERLQYKKLFNFRYTLYQNLKNLLFLKKGVLLSNFASQHGPLSYKKSIFDDVWHCEAEVLDKTCKSKFRTSHDILPWIMRDWQLALGEFYPICKKNRNIHYRAGLDNGKIHNTIGKKWKSICINDSLEECASEEKNFELYKEELIQIYQSVFPNKSSFEI